MHFKNSFLLATALTAGSAVARLHGHQRRHAHPQPGFNNQLQPESPAGPVSDGSLLDDVLNVRGFDNQLSPESPAAPITDGSLVDDVLNVRGFNNQLQPESPAAPIADGSLLGDVLNVRGFNNQLQPEAPDAVVTDAPIADALNVRAVGQTVTAEINGVMETWINNWAGQVAAATSSSSTTTAAAAPTAPPPPPPAPAPTESDTSSTNTQAAPTQAPPAPAPTSSGSNWSSTPANGVFSRSGFGGITAPKNTGSLAWNYVGNVGSPWGSNIIQVAEADASQYKHVLRFEGSKTEPWTVLFWNTYGPNGQMDGFWSPNKALTFTLAPGEVQYVAIDDNSQGGWAAAPGNSVPTTSLGQYAATWGEFDMSNQHNGGHSGWDVSCIIAQLNGMPIQGMSICNSLGQSCSYIGKGLVGLLSAYTSAQQGNPSLAVQQNPGPVRLVVTLDYVH